MSFSRRRAFTLVELLVVILIILAVTALAIGVSVPDVQTRRIREAARQVHAFIEGAKARAAETRRPVAVILDPAPNQRMAFSLRYGEIPLPYAGDLLTSRARIQAVSANGQRAIVEFPQDLWYESGMIDQGDWIKFNKQGHLYPIVATTAPSAPGAGDGTATIAAPTTTADAIRLPVGVGLEYQVTRGTRPSAAADLELPESVVVDFGLSGSESVRFTNPLPTPLNPVVLMFSPGGTLFRVSSGTRSLPATGVFYLLVTDRAEVETGGNLNDPRAIWIAVSANGKVISAENLGGSLSNARQFARKAQQMRPR